MVITADIMPNDGSSVSNVFSRVALAGRTNQHESTLIVVAIVIEKLGIPRIVIRVEPFAIARSLRKGCLIQPKEGIVCTPWPNPGVETAGATVAVQHHIMLNQCAIGRPGHDAITANILNIVVTDDNVEAGIPSGARGFGALGRDGGPVYFPNDVPLDEQVIEPARYLVAHCPEKNTPGLLALVCTAHRGL